MTRCDADPPPAPPVGGRHPHRTPAANRARLLTLATDLAAAPTGAAASHLAVGHVSMGDVARAAGVTRTALYRLWPSRQDFWDELVGHILTPRAGLGTPDLGPGRTPVAALDAAQDVLLADPLPLLRTGVVGYAGGSRATAALGAQRDEMVTLLEAGIEAHLGGRRRPAGGLTMTDLATAVTIIGNGLPLTARLAGPDAVRLVSGPGGRRHSLLLVLGAALVDRLTQDGPADTAPAPAAVAPPSPAGVRPDEAGGGRRSHYLAIASGLALRPAPDGLDHVLGQVTLDGLARAAGLTRRTLTNLWPDRTAFRLDLFSHLLGRERRGLVDAITAAIPRVEAEGPIPAFLALGDALHHEIVGALAQASSLAFAPHLDAPPLAERARHDHDALLDAVARSLRRLLSASGRRARPGIPLRGVALALTTVADGTNRLARTRPELLRDDIPLHGGRHTLTGGAVTAILEDLTEPLDTSGPVIDLARLLA